LRTKRSAVTSSNRRERQDRRVEKQSKVEIGAQLEGQRQRERHARQPVGDDRHQEQADRRTKARDPEPLDQQLLNEPAPARTERHSHRYFSGSHRRTRQQQARDVGAGDREDQPDGDEQHREERGHDGQAAKLLG
jgi:hypothetical protein